MALNKIAITNLRNIESLKLRFGSGVNCILGPNGSGKTSILEAVYMLGTARSFLTNKSQNLVRNGCGQCIVFGEVQLEEVGPPIAVGVTRSLEEKQQIKVAGAAVYSSAELAQLLPLLVINPSAFRLLEGGPLVRRQFIDWGVFHVEQSFLGQWKRFSRCLVQRNALLKTGSPKNEVEVWNQEFIESANYITEARRRYANALVPLFRQFLEHLTDLQNVEAHFYPGWSEKEDLSAVLLKAQERDFKYGFTHHGPHRADLRIYHMELDAQDTLSRGQQKLVVCALKLAQGALYSEATGRNCIYLLDDLAAELDEGHHQRLSQILLQQSAQLLITGVNDAQLHKFWSGQNSRMFHVKQGRLAS